MITDPIFYLAAVPAVLVYGVSKGGFAGAFGIVAVPVMALVVSPVQAAAILLPILCAMDLMTLWAYRGRWSWPELKVLLPASLAGIGVGTLAFGYLSPASVRLMLGMVAVGFAGQYAIRRLRKSDSGQALYGPAAGMLAGAAAGLTSFIAHAGGPPLGIYLLRRGLDRTRYVATSAVFFTAVNYTKLVPYAWLGQFDATNLATSLGLAPLAPAGVAAGVWLHRRVSDRHFFIIAYLALFGVGCKLLADGIAGR